MKPTNSLKITIQFEQITQFKYNTNKNLNKCEIKQNLNSSILKKLNWLSKTFT